ncbi:MAG: energy transducer TonB, partial [Pyrinomonadaceae bacterium]
GDGIGYGSGNGTGSGSGNGSGAGYGNGRAVSVVSKSFELKQPVAKTISTGVVNGRAESLPKPAFPSAARTVNASGAVNVQITIDETGNVIAAKAVSGHPLLRQAAEQAALNAKFTPTQLSGNPIKVMGVISYNFQNTEKTTPDVDSSVEEIREQTADEKMETEKFLAEKKRRENLAEKLHVWLFDLVEKPENNSTVNETSNKFISDGKAAIQIVFTEKMPDTFEKLKNLGFEIVSAKSQKEIFGKIETNKIAKLAEISETKYILPNIR